MKKKRLTIKQGMAMAKKLARKGAKNPQLHDTYYEKNYKKHPEWFS